MVLSPPRREHLMSALLIILDRNTHRLAVVTLLAVFVGHPIVFAEAFSSQPPDDSANTLIPFLADCNAPDTLRIIVSEREPAHIGSILAEFGVSADKIR